jgi:hypothetical protein
VEKALELPNLAELKIGNSPRHSDGIISFNRPQRVTEELPTTFQNSFAVFAKELASVSI